MLGEIWNTIIFNPMHNLLLYFYVLTGSLGTSIALIILVVRLVMTPLVYKQFSDTKKLNSLRPKLQDLQEKFKGDPQKLAAAQQKLYKEVGYNPLGCFVNFFVQLPIIIALYQSVLTFTQFTPENMPGLYPFVKEALVKLGQTTFNTNLFGIAVMENPIAHLSFDNIIGSLPYVILVILVGLSNFLPTYINMKQMKEQQQPIKKKPVDPNAEPSFEETFSQSMTTSTLYVMPVMVTFSMLSFPSIISVYLIIQNFVGLIQQLGVKLFHEKISSQSQS